MASTPEELYNASPSGIDPIIGMNSNGVSDSVKLADTVLSNPVTYDFGGETLSDSLKRVSELKVVDFNSIYTPKLTAGGISISGGAGGLRGAQIDPFGSADDNTPSWIGDRINVDEYYNQLGESWANLDKDNAQLIGIGGGVVAGAATGAAIGSLFTPVGTAIGAVVGGILGGIEGNQVSKNIGYGYVRNKFGYDEQAKYNQQGFWGRAGAGVMNMVHSADSLTLGTLGTIAYLPKAISERSLNVLFNNDFTKLLDDYDKSSQSSNRIYHSTDYDNSSLVGKLAHSEMWFEQVAPAVGFMIGAIGVGRATGLRMGAIGLGAGGATTGAASRAFLAETIGAAVRGEGQALGRQALLNGFKQAARQELKNQTFKSMAGNMVTLLTSASPESGLEARMAMNEAQENYIKAYNNAYGRLPTSEEIANFDQANKDSGNGVFAANLAVVGLSNWLQFGDAMGVNRVIKKGFLDDAVNRVFGLGIKRTLGEVSEKGLQSAVWEAVQRTKLQRLGYRALKALEAPATEGLWEEGIQHVISDTHKTYLESRFNPQATEINKSLLNAFGESFVNTYTTEEGWNDIMIGMIVGAMGTARTRGGFDVLNQREVGRIEREIAANVTNLNTTQEALISAHEDYLNKQAIYNNLSNESTARLNDKIGALNQQVINSDLSKKYIASGNLEQAQLAYQNALFAKLSAEKRAGLSESNKFDLDTMIDNIPEDTLTSLYNFRTPEQISDFKQETQTNLNNLVESFDAAYEMAESLNLGTKQNNFSPTQITEMAALNFFHGMHSADNANNLAQAIEQTVGINGVADAMNYYSNLTGVQQRRMSELEDLQGQLTELEDKHNELLNNFSTEVIKPQREGENEAIVSQLDRTNNQIAGVQSEIESVNNRINALTNILNSKESIPSMPFGNPAMKFFDSVNLRLADNEVSDVLGNLKSLDRYVEHLLDTTEKSEEDVAIDRNKAEMLQSLVGSYKAQMALMRNFAKAAQMIADPAYVNNLSRGIFNSKKYDAIFDNTDWVENNDSGFDELSKEEFRQLKEKLDSGVISKYDVHTFLTNAEILRMGASIQEGNTLQEVESDVVSKEDLQEIVNQDEEGNMNLDTSSLTYRNIVEGIAQDLAYGNELSPNQQLVYDAVKSNETEFETLNERINEIKSEAEVSPATLAEPDRNSRLAQEQRLNKIAEDKKAEINDRYDALIEALTGPQVSNNEGNLITNLDEILREGFGRIEIQNRKGEKVAFDMFDIVIDTDDNTAQVGYVKKTNRADNKGIGYEAYVELGTRLAERGITLVSPKGNKLTGGVELWNRLLREGYAVKTSQGLEFKVNLNTNTETTTTQNTRPLLERLQELPLTNEEAFNEAQDIINSIDFSNEDSITDGISRLANHVAGKDVSATKSTPEKYVRGKEKLIGNDNFKTKEYLESYANIIYRDFSNNEDFFTQPETQPQVEEAVEAQEESSPVEIGPDVVQIGELEAQRQSELDAVETSLQEALNPTEQRTVQINTELDRINRFVENVIDELKTASKELNVETVDNFDLNPNKVSAIFDEYEKLFNKENKDNNDEARLSELKSLINKYGLVEGRVIDYQGEPVRLSDVLEQRVFLENEHFNTETELSPLSDIETNVVTTESPTDDFNGKTKGGDPTVLNNYDFATFTGSNSNNEVTIANITPELLIGSLVNDKDVASIEVDNVEIDLSQANDTILEGQVVRVTFNDVDGNVNRVSFQLDKSKRIILPQGDIATLEANSNLRFNADNIIGSSGYYSLTQNINGVEVPVRSDFDIAQLIDSQAAQRLNPGDNVYFEVELNTSYNKGLLDRISPFLSTVSDEERAKLEPLLEIATEAINNTSRINVLKANIQSSQTYLDSLNEQIDTANDAVVDDRAAYNKDVVFPLLDKATAEDKKIQGFEQEINNLQSRNKQIRTLLNVDYNKIPYDRVAKNLEKKLGKAQLSDAQQKEFDALRKEFKDNMVIVSKDKSGNIVGVVKGFNNSNGQNAVYMDYLRNSLFSRLEQSGYKNAKSAFTVPVQIVYMGIPNISSTETGKVMYEFSRDNSQNSINPNKIMDIGYVTYNQLDFNSGAKYNTPYNYAQSIMRDKAYTGRKIPVVMFRYNGKDVIYPISLKESVSSDSVVSQFDTLANNKIKDFSTYINDLNEFLSDSKISPKYRFTSLNYTDEYVSQVRDVIQNSEFYPSVEEFLNSRNMAQTLIDNALIDIDLNNTPFIGPKIKLALNQVPEFTSELSSSDKIMNDNSPVRTDMEDIVDENECNIELD